MDAIPNQRRDGDILKRWEWVFHRFPFLIIIGQEVSNQGIILLNMRIELIRTSASEFQSISGHYSQSGFIESYLFHGYGANRHVAYYVTHGSPTGYLVLDCSGRREANYSNKGFAYYMLGIFSENEEYSDIDTIVTCECFGGFHVPFRLPVGSKTISMRPLSDQKAVLWAGWETSLLGNPYFCAVIMTPKELELVSKNLTGFASASPITDERVAKFESVSYYNQKAYVDSVIAQYIRKINGGEDTATFVV
jgi:hypothetical protein